MNPAAETWAETNRIIRGSARRFVASHPAAKMQIALVVLQMTVKFLNRVEALADEDYDGRQFSDFARTGACSSRMLEACQGRLEETTQVEAVELLEGPLRWEVLLGQDRTHLSASIAFSMISAAMSCLEMTAFSLFRSYPFRLWTILVEGSTAAQRVLAEPPCLYDRWTAAFLRQYNTCEALMSEGVFVLWALSFLLRFDNTRIECRNAALKRITRALGATHQPLVDDVTADFFLLRSRLIERFGAERPQSERAERKPTRDGRLRVRRFGRWKGSRSGGGGTQRSLMSACLKGQRWSNKEERRKAFAAANEQFRRLRKRADESWNKHVRVGAAGTVSHRHGGVAFGSHPRKRRRSNVGTASVEGLLRTLPSAAEGNDAQLVVVEQACARVVDALVTLREQPAQKRRRVEEEQRAIAAWRASAEPVPCSLLQGAESHLIPYGSSQPQQQFRVVYSIPPGTAIARRALANSGRIGGIRTRLRAAWSHRCTPLQHDNVPRCQRPSEKQKQEEKPSTCFTIGRCICGDGAGKVVPPLARSMRSLLSRALVKRRRRDKSALRGLYDACGLFIRIVPVGMAGEQWWYHIGCGNLSTLDFVLFPMTQLQEHPDGHVTVQAQPPVINMLRAALLVDAEQDLDLQFWQAFQSSQPVAGPFTPGTLRLQPAGEAPQPLRRVARPDRPASPPPPPLALQDGVVSDAEEGAGEEEEEEGDDDEQGDADGTSSDDGGGGDDDGDGARERFERRRRHGFRLGAQARALRRRVRDMAVRAWLLDDDGGADASEDDGGGAPRRPDAPPLPPQHSPQQPARRAQAEDPSVAGEAEGSQPPPPQPPPEDRQRAQPASEGEEGVLRRRGAGGEHAPAGSRSYRWGPFSLAMVYSSGEQVGWGCTCRQHKNRSDRPNAQCKLQLRYGARDPLSDSVCQKLLKQWLLAGIDVAKDDHARDMHMLFRPRDFDRDISDAELDRRLAAFVEAGRIPSQ